VGGTPASRTQLFFKQFSKTMAHLNSGSSDGEKLPPALLAPEIAAGSELLAETSAIAPIASLKSDDDSKKVAIGTQFPPISAPYPLAKLPTRSVDLAILPTERETKKPKLEKPENLGSMSASAKTHWKQRRAKHKPGNTRF
jgi:hypothetical protein